MNTTTPRKSDDMHVVRSLFAIRFTSGGSNGLAELYVEDDGVYHLQTTFDVAWLPDLIAAAKAANEHPKKGSR